MDTGYSPGCLFSALVPVSFILSESSSPSEVFPESAEDLAPSPPSSTRSPLHLLPGVRCSGLLGYLLCRCITSSSSPGSDLPPRSTRGAGHPREVRPVKVPPGTANTGGSSIVFRRQHPRFASLECSDSGGQDKVSLGFFFSLGGGLRWFLIDIVGDKSSSEEMSETLGSVYSRYTFSSSAGFRLGSSRLPHSKRLGFDEGSRSWPSMLGQHTFTHSPSPAGFYKSPI